MLVSFYGGNEKKAEVDVNREGKVILPFLGPVSLTGMTYAEASKFLKEKVKSELIGTEVNLSIREVRSVGCTY